MAISDRVTVVIKPDPTYIVEVGKQGPPGPISDTFIHNQAGASDTWTIHHHLDKWPSVMIVDSAGQMVLGDIEFTTADSLVITFAIAFAGKAFLN
jgi:hypothetical protein